MKQNAQIQLTQPSPLSGRCRVVPFAEAFCGGNAEVRPLSYTDRRKSGRTWSAGRYRHNRICPGVHPNRQRYSLDKAFFSCYHNIKTWLTVCFCLLLCRIIKFNLFIRYHVMTRSRVLKVSEPGCLPGQPRRASAVIKSLPCRTPDSLKK